MLTEKKLSRPNYGSKNDKVIRVVKELKSINEFRNGRIDENRFLKIVENIYPKGFIWQVFLFHIAHPDEFPIADEHVFRSFSFLQSKNKIPKEGWEKYKEYKIFFFDVAKHAGIIEKQPKKNECDSYDIVYRLKKVDDALFSFGQFLKKYN